MTQLVPLIALDAGQLIWIAVFVIVGLSSMISNYLSKQKEEEQKQARRRARRQAMEVEPLDEIHVGGQQGGGAGRKPAGLEDEIGEFLRRAARGDVQRPAQQPPPAQQPRPQQARPAQAGMPPRPAQPRQQPRRQARPRPQPQRRPQAPVAAEIVEPARPPVGKGLSEQVARDINTEDIARRTKELGKETRQTTSKIEKKLHDTFDHKVGSLGSDVAEVEPETTSQPILPMTSAAGLGALLSDAESVKQAIILNEIFQRPVHRW